MKSVRESRLPPGRGASVSVRPDSILPGLLGLNPRPLASGPNANRHGFAAV
jgi:hypothetical protein